VLLEGGRFFVLADRAIGEAGSSGHEARVALRDGEEALVKCDVCGALGYRRGQALNGKRNRVYVLRFPRREVPEAERFWSLTAYLPGSIQLVPNKAKKYVVASYTSGLERNRDGSISIYMSKRRPLGVAAANWLPVPAGKFNVMLRVYGPKGNTAGSGYLPPAVGLRK
jgi:hypothetical protein